MVQQSELSDALSLEQNRFMKYITETAAEAQADVNALERQLAARGTLLSGARYSGEMRIRLGKIQNVVEKAIALRRELGSRIPELLEEQHLDTLKSKLDKYVDSVVAGFIQRLSSRPLDLGGAIREAFRADSERQAGSIKAQVNSELQALVLESRLGLHQEEKPVATFNISHSTIAALNLGTVFGDLTASVQNLTDQGQEKVAEVIRRLTEEITASKELQNAQRKELLEHLSFISTEIALPRERRKMGPLNSSVAFLKTSLGAVAELATLLPMAEQALKAAGVFTSS